MLPVVRGDRETTRQIVLYSLVLVGFSVVPFAAGWFSAVYLAAALALGAAFIWLAVALRREQTPRRSATCSTTRSSTWRCSSWPRPSDRSSSGRPARPAAPAQEHGCSVWWLFAICADDLGATVPGHRLHLPRRLSERARRASSSPARRPRPRGSRSPSRTCSTPPGVVTTYGSIHLRRPRARARPPTAVRAARGGRLRERRQDEPARVRLRHRPRRTRTSATVPNPRRAGPDRRRLERRLRGGARRRARRRGARHRLRRLDPDPGRVLRHRRLQADAAGSSRSTAASRSRRATTTPGRWRATSRAASAMLQALAPGFEPRPRSTLEDVEVGVAWTELADPLVARAGRGRGRAASRAGGELELPLARRRLRLLQCARSPTSTASSSPSTRTRTARTSARRSSGAWP